MEQLNNYLAHGRNRSYTHKGRYSYSLGSESDTQTQLIRGLVLEDDH